MEKEGSTMKAVVVGVSIFVMGAAIVGAAGNTIANSMNQRTIQAVLREHEEDIKEQQQVTKSIDVMAEQIADIKEDVGKILKKLEEAP